MFSTILVPLDGSPWAQKAYPYVILEQLVHLSQALPVSEMGKEASQFQKSVKTAYTNVEHYLHFIVHLSSFEGIETKIVVLFGPLAQTMLAIAQAYQASLIV